MRSVGVAGDGFSIHAAVAAAMASTTAASGIQLARRTGVSPDATAGAVGTALLTPLASSAASASASSRISRASPMSRNRCFGSFTRQRPMSRLMRGGTSAGSSDRLTSRVSTCASVSGIVSDRNGARPVSIS